MQKLSANRLSPAEYKFQEWAVVLEHGTSLEDALNKDFWAHVAKEFKQGDILHVRSEDHTLYARLYVRASDRLWAKVGVIEVVKFGEDVKSSDEGLEVKWNVGKRTYSVVRKSDNQSIKEGFPIKEDAVAWMNDHNKQMAA